MIASPFARRLVALFVLAAMLPTVLLGLLSYWEYSSELRDIHSDHDRRGVKQAGLALHDWLRQRDIEIREHLATGDLDASEAISGLEFARLDTLALSADDRERVLAGGAVIKVEQGRGFIGRLVPRRGPPQRVLLKRFNELPSPYATVEANSSYCYVDNLNKPLQCSKSTTFAPHLTTTMLQAPYSSTITYEARDYDLSRWEIFMAGDFAIPAWEVVVWRPKVSATALGGNFPRVIAPVIVLTLLIVIFVSLITIRRLLDPLRQLTAGTEKLVASNFDVRVDIDSGDEVEQLGNAFNDMAAQMKRQFEVLSKLSSIDHTMLASKDLKSTLRLLVESVPELVDCDAACLCLVVDVLPPTAIVAISLEDGVDIEEIEIDSGAVKRLTSISGPLAISGDSHLGALEPIVRHGVMSGHIFPLVVDDAHYGALFAGMRHNRGLPTDGYTRLQELIHRATIVVENAAQERRLYRQAHIDTLTDLPNRRMLIDILHTALRRAVRTEQAVGVLFVDLDDFKEINDSLGHSAGDQLLQTIANRLLDTVRTTDAVARLGGDEFVVVLPDLDRSEITARRQLHALAHKLLGALKEVINLHGEEVRIGASIGASIFPSDADNAEELLRNADTAMYAVKDQGRHGFGFHSHELHARVARRLRLKSELAKALEEDEFVLFFQPKVATSNNQVVGCEALIRWHHPTLGLVGPGEFVDEAERSGAIHEIGEFVMRQACRHLAQWSKRGLNDFTVGINVSARQFNDQRLLERLQTALEESGLDAQRLELEITETAACNDLEHTVATMQRMKAAGFRIAIDDFGTGNSSLQYIQRMPVDTLKIDRAFVEGIGHDQRSEGIIDAIISLGQALSMTLVAEGVEEQIQVDYLRRHRCDLIQGYFFGPPVDATQFEHLLLESNRSLATTRSADAAVPRNAVNV